MEEKIRSLIPGDYPTLDALMELPHQASTLYLSLAERVVELGTLQLSAIEQLHAQLERISEGIQALETEISQREIVLASETSTRYTYTERFESELGTQSSTLHREPRGGFLSLRPIEMVDLLGAVRSFRILPSLSIGIPGNNMVIERIDWDKTEKGFKYARVTTVGQEDRRANIAAMFDGRLDTLFEWEKNVIPPKQRLVHADGIGYSAADDGFETDVWEATKGFGWDIIPVYPEQEIIDPTKTVRMAELSDQPGEPARVVFEIEFEEPVHAVLETVLAASGGLLPRVFLLQKSLDGSRWEDLLEVPGGRRVVLGAMRGEKDPNPRVIAHLDGARWLRIGFVSGGWYSPRLGLAHPYVVAVIDETFRRKFLWGAINSSEHRLLKWRVETEPEAVGSIVVNQNLPTAQLASSVAASALLTAQGLTMRWLTQAIGAQAVKWLGAAAPAVAFVLGVMVLGGIYGESKERSLRELVHGYDIFRGWRSAIAIREMRFLRPKYSREGYWLSRAVLFSEAVKRIALHTEQHVPEGTEIKYWLSTDMSHWREVQPVQYGGTVLSLDSPTRECYIRVEMRTEDEMVSPALYSFGLEAWVS